MIVYQYFGKFNKKKSFMVSFLGNDFTDRQRIKPKAHRLTFLSLINEKTTRRWLSLTKRYSSSKYKQRFTLNIRK